MKNIFIISLIVVLASCGAKKVNPENKQDTASVQQTSLADGTISPLTEITDDNANGVTSFENTPESIVMYFFASKIRKDNEWEKVCLPKDQRSDKLKRGLDEYNNWGFTKYRFVDKKEFDKGKFWVKIYMSITYEGATDDGEDEVTVEMIDGNWLITEVPT